MVAQPPSRPSAATSASGRYMDTVILQRRCGRAAGYFIGPRAPREIHVPRGETRATVQATPRWHHNAVADSPLTIAPAHRVGQAAHARRGPGNRAGRHHV